MIPSPEDAAPGIPLSRDTNDWVPPPPPMHPRIIEREDPLDRMLHTLKAMLWSSGFLLFLAVMITGFVIVLAMTPEIQRWIITPQSTPGEGALPMGYIFLIVPEPVVLFTVAGFAFQAWHLLMLGILALAFSRGIYGLATSWSSGRGRAVESLGDPDRATSGLEGAAKLFMAGMFFTAAYFMFLALAGIHMSTPDFGSMGRPELIYRLFSASVFEELISRVMFIGVPLAVVGVLRRRPGALGKLVGGGMTLDRLTLSLIVFSGVMFALGHVMSWDLWKVPQVLVTGLAMGYAFVRYGLHASMLIHFTINLGDASLQVWPDSAPLAALLGMIFLVWAVTGAYFFYRYSKALAGWFLAALVVGRGAGTGKNGGTGTPGPDTGRAQPRGFICPNCGGMSAAYDSGTLTCLGCGGRFGGAETGRQDPGRDMIEF